MSEGMFLQKAAGLARAAELLLEEKKQYKQAAINTVNKLVELGAVKTADREKVANAITNDRDKIFNIITNLAATNQKQAAELKKKAAELQNKEAGTRDYTATAALGHADTRAKESAIKEKTSDEIWNEKFGV